VRRWTDRQSGFSYLEVLLAGAIIGTALTALGVLMGTLAHGQQSIAFQSQARTLAHSLLQEVLTRDYADADNPGHWGLESGEIAGDRSTYDDVDDFDGFAEKPPTLADGTAIPGFDNFGWSVQVDWVDLSTYPGGVRGYETNIKRILVEVYDNGELAADVEGFKADPNEGR
jgi:type II secretory pathway pseudopilin PulG